MGRSYKKEGKVGSSKASKESLKNKNRQINKQFGRYAYNSSEDKESSKECVDDFEDYADDFSFEKFSRNNGKR